MATSSLQKQQLIPLAALLTLLTVTLLTLLVLLLRLPAIETDLLQRTRQALTEAGLPTENIRFDGRDGILTGTVGNETDVELLENVVANVWGVRAVRSHLITANSKEATDVAAKAEIMSPLTGQADQGALHTPSREYAIEQVNLDAIRFEYSRAELDEAAVEALDKVVAELQGNPDMNIEVSAHTDNRGTALGNMAVTQARAEAVRNYLLSKGIESRRVVAQGYGSTRPVADNSSSEGREQNRRIEITVIRE